MNLLLASLPWRRGPASLSRRLLLLLLAVGLTPLVLSQLVTLGAFLDQEHHHMVGVAEELAAEKVQEAQTLLISKGIQLDQMAQASRGQVELLQRDWRQQAAQLAFSDLLLVNRMTRRVTSAAVHTDLIGLHLEGDRLRRSGLHQAVRNLSPWNQMSVASLESDPGLGGVAAWLAVPLQKERSSPIVLVGRLDGTAFEEMAFKRQRGLAHGLRCDW